MSKAIFLGLLVLLASLPAFAAKKVTVEQLSREIASSAKKKDSKIAGHLYELQLTERLSAQKLAAFEAALPGPKSRRALVALSDQAEFLDPPAAEIPNQPAPSIDQQRAIIAKAVDYAAATLHRLPDLFAREDTIRYEDSPPGLQIANSQSASGTFVPYQPLHPVSRSVATILYRDGQEVVQTGAEAQGASAMGLTTSGEFGSIFSVVFGDLPKGKLEWSHWEGGKPGPVAVFRFAVPEAASHYQVKFCCVAGSIFQQFSTYHGELTLDPSNGTILRLTLIADLGRGKPISEAELMVEYGPEDLGAKTYFCPVRSVSITLAPMQGTRQGGGPVNLNQSPMYMRGAPTVVNNNGGGGGDVPLQTMLNEVAFDQYHLFRADVQILTAGNTPPAPAQSAPANSAHNPEASSATAPVQQPPSVAQNSSPAAPEDTSPSAGSERADAGSPASTSTAMEPLSPQPANSNAPIATPPVSSATTPPNSKNDQEIAIAAPASLPDTSTPSQASTNTAFSLRLNARLVDIGVTAYDRKGRPITDLTADDFVIYDNGRKESLRSFSHSGSAPANPRTSAATPQQVLFSNRLDAMSNAPENAAQPAESSTVLLLDPTNLDFADLTHAREQVLKFLERLPNSEPVGLYVRNNFGFQILAEQTTDHDAISSALRKWMPAAPDLARAQEEERRNRQEFDTVESPDDMQNVNGNMGGMITPDTAPPTTSSMGTNMNIPGGGSGTTSDPKLMREGSNPGREALIALVAVAAHMNAIPGHKDLVWIASDNVLANWTDQAPGTDKGANTIDRFTLGAQEALNNAHVSLYPLDASQLETAATDASLQNNSVQVNPATSNPTNVGGVDQMEGGRAQAAMRQNIRAVQPAMQQMAESTGGRVFGRSDDIVRDLKTVIDDGHASYLLSFAPDTPPDGKYHKLTVTVPARRDVTLRYRAGYLYTQEPSLLKDRFKLAVWQPQDETEIGLNAHWDHASQGAAVSLNIAATDLSLTQQGGRWQDRVDVFLVQRDVTGTHADVKEQTLVLNMKADTYQKVLHDGIPFADYIEQKPGTGTVRVIVVDEDSQRMGSVTLPVPLQQASR
ncbi:MAG TPA: VWA domain-containing protein [Terracidiphilus sp.]|nr:VWA domain-containing protein [Terracidiphilus sp.]